MLSPTQALALMADPALILAAQRFDPDPWQRDFLLAPDRQILLLCSRGAGKSRSTSALALHTALFQPGSLTLLVSPSQRQSVELFRYVKQGFHAVGRPVETVKENETTLELANRSRVVCLPGREGTIRSYQGVRLLVLDEAARVPDDLYCTVRPMLAVSQGRLVALTTPWGQRGWFHDEWQRNDRFKKVRVPWQLCPRINAAFIANERASLGDRWVQQEYECSFGALEGLVYPTFADAEYLCYPAGKAGKAVGGIDFGWRNPFAAVWGVLDHDDVLWVAEERYLRETPLHEHARALKEAGPVLWAADPSHPTEIHELRSAGLKVVRGTNDIAAGVAAVTARLSTGRLKVCSTTCWNLLAEAKLYRYPAKGESRSPAEKPLDEHNHALSALRYLVSRIDARFVARLRRQNAGEGAPEAEAVALDAGERTRETQRSVFGYDAEQWTDPDLWDNR